MSVDVRIGYGYDVHRLVKGRLLKLGGVEIPHAFGLEGHSDADVLIHAVCDALLGAAALGDIGQHFPDTDEEFENIDSRKLLVQCKTMLDEKGYAVGNIDATVVAEEPKLAPYIEAMRQHMAHDLEIDVEAVSVKATTSESIGFEGKKEGISASAVAVIYRKNRI